MADARPQHHHEPLPLVRDVLDKQVLDPDDCKVGKVDGIVLALRAHRPPRVMAMELGQATAWRRIAPPSRRLRRLAAREVRAGREDRPRTHPVRAFRARRASTCTSTCRASGRVRSCGRTGSRSGSSRGFQEGVVAERKVNAVWSFCSAGACGHRTAASSDESRNCAPNARTATTSSPNSISGRARCIEAAGCPPFWPDASGSRCTDTACGGTR